MKQGGWLGIQDPQWWVGRSVAELKAGPWADELEVRRVEGRMRGVEKGKRERKEKLREGLRRQREGLGMCD